MHMDNFERYNQERIFDAEDRARDYNRTIVLCKMCRRWWLMKQGAQVIVHSAKCSSEDFYIVQPNYEKTH